MTTLPAGKGPPAPLLGPYHMVPSYRTAVTSNSQLQRSHGVSLTEGSEPVPKRQKLIPGIEYSSNTQDPVLGVALPATNVADTTPVVDADSVQGGANKQDPNAHGKQLLPTLFPVKPSRGLKSRNKQQGSILAIERAAMKHTVQTKAYVVEPPASAPRYQRSEPADFFPWTGHHPEDVLNEVTTRNGFYDKLPASQNESLPARPSILSSLKTKSGLHILSSLFASALDQRQLYGTITAASTFKPPPRVTLTDTKREAWLRDLADPSIPLRRLSRTIPHGVRGKILLDHCQSKDIPVSRAIWLVKCVGANEIRAFKRKGTSGVFTVGGEPKWIRDWTTNVEQFLEAIINTCGSHDWRARINYGLRLVSHIYQEHLLDQEQYLKWLMDHLATSDLDRLPVWLLIMNIHKQDLLRYRQHGKRVVQALLAQLSHAQKPANVSAYNMLSQELVEECRFLMTSSLECFLLPRCWKTYERIIQDSIVQDDTVLRIRLKDVSMRNKELQGCPSARDDQSQTSPEQKIVASLDSLTKMPDYPKTAAACLKETISNEALVKTCLQWAITSHRFGQFRTYAAARLLRIWSEHSVDLQEPIFHFLANRHDVPDIDEIELYRLCAELVSSKHLSVGRYFQWLMARGTLHHRQHQKPSDSCEVRLLRELPLHGLPDHILNLRSSLLSSIGVTNAQEITVLEATKKQIAEKLPRLLPLKQNVADKHSGDSQLSVLSRTTKSELAWWLRELFDRYLLEGSTQGNDLSQLPAMRVTLEEFNALRYIFEDLQEYAVFVDVLRVLTRTTTNGDILAAITDTVNYYFDVFNALGAAQDLFQSLFGKRKLLPNQQGTDPSFTQGLIDLAIRLPNTSQELRRLRKEESILDPKHSAAAPSPISDNMVEAVHADNPTFFEEMDQILTNGTSIDEPTLARCFGTVTDHLEKSWDEAIALPSRYPELLARLRAFEQNSFDELATSWLDRLLFLTARPSLSTILVPMICHNVYTLSVVLDRARTLLGGKTAEEVGLIALELLEMLSSVQNEHMPAVTCRIYRFLHQQRAVSQIHAEWLIPLIHRYRVASKGSNGTSKSQSEKLMSSNTVKSFNLMVLSYAVVAEQSATQHNSALQSAMADILFHKEQRDLSTLEARQKFSRLLDDVSNFNKPLSRLGLQSIRTSISETGQNPSDLFADVLMEKLGHASLEHVNLWSCLLSSLPADSALPIRERAEQAILSRIDNPQISESMDDRPNIDYLMDIVVATAFSIPTTGATSVLEQVSQRLSILAISPQFNNHQQSSKSELDQLANNLKTFLRLLSIHQSAIQNPTFPQSTLSRICLSLALLLHIHLSTSSHLILVHHIFDVLVVLSDSLSDNTRSQCIETLANSQGIQDPWVVYTFGNANSCFEGEWLQLVSKAASAPETTTTLPYTLRRWEMMQDATPVVTENDTSLSLTIFGARRSVL